MIYDIFPDISQSDISKLNAGNFKKIIIMDILEKVNYFVFQSAPLEPDGIDSGFILLLRNIMSEYETRQREKESLVQIEQNLEQLAILNDHIRNPLSVIVGISSFERTPGNEVILRQADEINRIISELDNNYLKSDKVRRVLKSHYDLYPDD